MEESTIRKILTGRSGTRTGSDLNRKTGYHSRAYHRFFEGYAEFYENDKNGKPYIRRVYVGPYYCPEGTRKEQLADKISGLLLYFVATSVYVICCVQKVWYNAFAPIVFFEALVLFLLLFFLFPFTEHVRAGKRLMIREYRDASELYRKESCAAAYSMWAMSVTVFISALAVRKEMRYGILLCAGFMVSGTCMYFISQREKKRTYRKEPGQNAYKHKSSTIEY